MLALKGEKPGQMAVNNYHHGKPVLNLKQAHKLGIKFQQIFNKKQNNMEQSLSKIMGKFRIIRKIKEDNIR